MESSYLLLPLLGAAVFVLLLLGVSRAAAGGQLPAGVLFLGGLAVVLLFGSSCAGAGFSWVGVMLILVVVSSAVFLLNRAVGGRPAACPRIGTLQDFLAERLPPQRQARLAAHLDRCTACQHRVEGLTAGQEAWRGVARNLPHEPPAPAPALRKVIERLKGNHRQEATRDEPALAGNLPLGFLSPADKPGQLGRLERYEVLEEVGRGGMGVVLKAFDPTLHRVVAIKVLAPQLASSGVARKRFLREAKAAAAVTHDHIVTIHAVDEANGLPYLVMQYVAGQSLQDRIDREGPLSDVAEIIRIGLQTASALAAAHGHGIVHRDVKPANILLEEGVQRVKITDFGLARAVDDASMTQSGVVAGSPLYMAPEQARGEALDHRADLFSLGSVLYTVCTGRPPFRAANTLAVLRRVCEDPPRPIRETNPEVPDWLASAVDRLMTKDPAGRFQSAAEVVEVFGQHLAPLRHPACPSPSPAGTADSAGLPTSVTICPHCGATLHASERMAGKTVHCGECGRPFPVAEGSEEVLVARAVPSPFGRRPRTRKPVPGRVLILGGGAVLSLLLVLVGLLAFTNPEVTRDKRAAMPEASRAKTPNGPPFWKDSLGQLPAEATLFGAADFTPFGSAGLEDEWLQPLFRLVLSPAVQQKLTQENLGRIRISGISAAYYDTPKPERRQGFVHLHGVALDGRKRALAFLREAGGEGIRIEEDEKGSWPGKPVRVSGADLPFALGILDDHHVFLARSLQPGSKESEHLKALERLPGFGSSRAQRPSGNLLSGYNPPWIRTALLNVPSAACGLCLGEIPAVWRRQLAGALGIRECPRTFVLHLTPEGEGVLLSLRLSVERAGEGVTLREDLEAWRRQGLDELRDRFPVLGEEPQALALLWETLRNVRWEVTPGGGTTTVFVRLSGPTWKALGVVLQRVSRRRGGGQKDG